MVKGINKLSRSQKNAPAKSQTRISSFFTKTTGASNPPAPSVVSATCRPAPPTAPAPAPGGGATRRSPRKSAILVDVTGDTVSPNSSPPKPPPADTTPVKTPAASADLDDSCEIIPSSGGSTCRRAWKENRMTEIAGRAAAADAGADAGGGVDVEAAVLNGPRLVQRLTKRPARPVHGLSPDRKRPTGAAGVTMTPSGVAGLSAAGRGQTRDFVSVRESDAVVRSLTAALDAGGADLAAKAVGDSAWTAPPTVAPASAVSGPGPDQRIGRVNNAECKPPLAAGRDSGLPASVDTAAAAADGGGALPAVAVAALSPQKRPRHRTPEPDQASELLFESVADLDFSSPFKEEAAARSAPARLPRSADPSVPAWQRFDRYSVSFVDLRPDGSTVLSLQATESDRPDRTITLRGSWSATRVQTGDIVHVLHAPNDVIDNLAGQLVVSPDRLISGTSVVSAVFCARKAVLSEMFRGLEPGNKAMLIGTLVHQLFQEVMRDRLRTAAAIRSRVADLLHQAPVVGTAYGGKLSSTELADEMDQFVAPILAWVRRYAEWGRDAEVAPPIARTAAPAPPPSGDVWDGRVTALKDIEENYWSPRLGIKGKIDLTVEVKCRRRSSQVLPLELKTGRPSFSAEHQGQVTLYAMMTSERRADPGSGLLLYLRTGAMREVSAGQHQQRDLLQLRNELVHHLRAAPTADAAGQLQLPPLPDVISNERACQRCPHVIACTAYQRPCDPPHAVPDAASHLSAAHLAYFLRWSLLLRLESACGAQRVSMARLWCQAATERQARGQALAACLLRQAERTATGWLHRLQRPDGAPATQLAAGDLVMVGTDLQLAVCMGSLVELTDTEVRVLLDRDLTSYPGGAELRYHVDKCEYQVETSMGTYFSSLARLLENTEHSRRLRELLIDRQPPAFLPGLGRLVITKCRAILRPLNKLQQRALLRVMMAEDYLLIQGMPGTGKTSTIVALVRLLVTMGRSVLLASYTHSAVDTILLKLKETFTDFVRLGRTNRVHAELQSFCSENMTQKLTTPEQLAQFYDARPVVATTCLGTNHPVFQRRKFDICIIDEASQIVQPAALAPVLLAGRFVLVGDPQQLPPVIQSPEARRRGMDESLFSQLAADDNTVQLTVQYRMNRTLTAAANHLTYEGRLSCGSEAVDSATLPSVERKPGDAVWVSAALDPALERALLLLDTSDLPWRHTADKHGAVSNAAEAALVTHIADQMMQRGIPAEEIGVIALYRGQVKLLRAALPAPLEVNTVDQYQGRDKSVILYSCTRTAARHMATEGDSTESTDILSDHRRLTVAVTRAKHKLVLVGRRDALATYPPFCRLFDHLGAEHTLRLTPAQVSSLPDAS